MSPPLRGQLFDCITGKLRPAMPQKALLNSSQLDWRGYFLEHYRPGGVELHNVFSPHTVVVLHLHRQVVLEWQQDGCCEERCVEPGQICLIPPEVTYSMRSDDLGEFLAVSFNPTFMLVACQDALPNGLPQLAAVHGVDDRVAEGLCLGLMAEAESGGRSGRPYSDSLAATLAIHLASRYADQKPAPSKAKAGLSTPQLRRVLDHIQENLQGDLSLQTMAAVAGLSPFHFARLFKKSCGLSPYQFVLKQRVERAKQLFLHGERSIAAIAHEVGFFDQSHLTTHFKRFCGMTPKEFQVWLRS